MFDLRWSELAIIAGFVMAPGILIALVLLAKRRPPR